MSKQEVDTIKTLFGIGLDKSLIGMRIRRVSLIWEITDTYYGGKFTAPFAVNGPKKCDCMFIEVRQLKLRWKKGEWVHRPTSKKDYIKISPCKDHNKYFTVPKIARIIDS